MTFYATLPSWSGVVLLTGGAAILLTSPKIVSFNLFVLERLYSGFLNIIAEASGIRYTLPSDSILWKGARFSYWLVILLVGVLMAASGTIILLKSSFRL